MSDFRSQLYERYVSSFKGDESKHDEHGRQAYWSWFEHKYVPLLAGLDPADPVLELGCGPGLVLELLTRRGFTNAEGIDISREQVEIAAARGLNARVADVFEHLAASENRVAAILALDFVEHFSKDELLRLAEAMQRALRPGGRLILQTPNGAGLLPNQVVYGDLTHLTILTPGSLTQLLRTVGFERFTFRETGPAPVNLKARVRIGLWRVIKLVANTVRAIEAGKSQEVWTENLICCCYKPV